MAAGAALAASWGGALHPLGDSLAVIRVPLAVVFALAVIWAAWPRRVRWPLAGLALWAIGAIALPRMIPLGTVSDHDLSLYQQNLLYNRRDDAAWLDSVARHDPDVITLQEVSGRNLALLDSLAAAYPTQVACPFRAVGGVAVLSRLPAVPGTAICAGGDGLAAVQVETAFGPVWLVSLHLHWPWPYGQPEQVARLLPVLQGLEGHVILAGDFNAVAWSHTLRRIEAASGTTRIGPWAPTFHTPPYGIPLEIDHVLTGPAHAQEVVVLPKHGSDHNGVLALLTRPRGE